MTNKTAIKRIFDSLKPVQKQMFLSCFVNKKRKYVIHSSRRLGKTYFLCALSICYALKKANSHVRYASVTQKAVKKMVHPICKKIFELLPKEKRGKWNSQESAYIFKNGSMIHVVGVNLGRADDARGTDADLFVVDEAGFVDELCYLVDSVAMPQLLTIDGSQLIMSSSSPLSPAHEFTSYIASSRLEDYYASYDIYQGQYEDHIIAEFCKEAGGPKSTTWRREYLNELIVDEIMSIVPEWKDSYIVDAVARDEYYKYYHKYESADWGVRDNTALLFGHYDFRQAKLKVEREFILSGHETTTKNISDEIEKIETELQWKDIYRRVGDSNEIIIMQDLGATYSKHFIPTTKDSLAAMVNEMRLWVQSGRIEIDKSCKNLIGCLRYGVFQDEKRITFGRSKDFGHYDALASLMYLIRNIDQHTNPVPQTHGVDLRNSWVPQKEQDTEIQATFRKLFNKN